MVKRKTRLLSALAVVMMLASLCACIVLPATAETEGVYPISEWSTYTTNANGYTVASIADLEQVAAHKGDFAVTQTIYIKGDLNFDKYTGAAANLAGLKASLVGDKADGTKVKISNLVLTAGWLGDYKGAAVKNLAFENCSRTTANNYDALLIDEYEGTLLIQNVSMTSCSNESSRSTLMIGRTNGEGTTVTFKNIEIIGCTLKPGVSENGFLLGKTNGTGHTINLDTVYIRDNVFLNTTANSSTLSNITSGTTLSFKNVAVFNTKLNNKTRNGLLTGTKDGTIAKFENVIVAGAFNAGYKGLFPSGTSVTSSSYYADIPLVAGGTVGAGHAAAIASGEAAWALNAAGATQKWALDAEGKILFATANDKPTYKVTLNAVALDGSDRSFNGTYYTDKTGKLILDNAAKEAIVAWEGESLLTRVFEGDATVEGKLLAEHQHTYEGYQCNAETDKHFQICTYTEAGYRCPVATAETGCSFEWNTPDPALVAPEDGPVHSRTCSLCGNTDGEEGCSLEKSEVGVQCGIPGSIVYTCETCGYRHEETITREHKWTWVPDAENPGKHLRDCEWEDCSGLETGLCADHYGEWVTVDATREEEGSRTRTCELCGYDETEKLPKVSYIELVKKPSAIAGQTTEIWVKLVNNPGLSGMSVELEYDTAVFEIDEISKGALLEALGTEVEFVTSKDGAEKTSFAFAINNDAMTITEDGILAVLKFNVASNAEEKAYEFKVTNTATDINGTKVTVESDTDTLLIQNTLRGDLNKDGYADIADAVLLLRYVREKQDQTQMVIPGANIFVDDTMADLNGVDGVNIQDVVYLLQYINGWYTDQEFFGT